MATKKYTVSLTHKQRHELTSISKNYRYTQRERRRAAILLLAEQGQSDQDIAHQTSCHWMTVRNVRMRFCQQEITIIDTARPLVKRAHQFNRALRALDGHQEAHLVALACSTPPDGANRWTLQLLHDHLIHA